jgi:hypothetical protein
MRCPKLKHPQSLQLGAKKLLLDDGVEEEDMSSSLTKNFLPPTIIISAINEYDLGREKRKKLSEEVTKIASPPENPAPDGRANPEALI